ncbi:MAG: bacteriohemerythrin [Halochromatium sp.]|uniref:bacteriohemerythrin n=1 Tax=Halochromatium sp. TaxID=2049430 RepID=UPI00397B92A1
MQKTGPTPDVEVTPRTASTGARIAPIMKWDERYSVNVAEIDRQHRQLFALYNKLHAAMLYGEGNQVLDLIFDELVEYTRTHFKDEERYFCAIDYAGTKTHIREHQAFIDRLAELQDKFHARKAFLTIEILAFIRDWLNEHIKGTDQQYKQV